MNTNAILILALPILCFAGAMIVLVFWSAQTMVVQGYKHEAWSAFATFIHGVYEPHSLGVPDHVSAMYGDYPIHLDTYIAGVKGAAIEYTRLRAFYAMRAPFELVAASYPDELEQAVTKNLQAIHRQDTGLKVDILTSNVDAARRFLIAESVYQKVVSTQYINLQIRRRRHWRDTGVSNSIYEVHLQMPKVVTDSEYLMSMYALIVACLDQLHQMGYAHRSFADGMTNATTAAQSSS